MSGKRFSGDKAKRNGFYIALAVCLVAIGVAAWSTYRAVNNFVETTEPVNEVNQNSVASKPPKTKQPRVDDEDGETKQREKVQSAVSQTESSSVQETAGTPEESKAEQETAAQESGSAFISQPQEYGEPVNAGVIYEISEVLVYPVESTEILKPYSAGKPVFSETMKDWRIHNGIDLQAKSGEKVKACANGMVKEIKADNLLGNVIVVEHGDYEFTYCGMNEEFLVKEGDIVNSGQELGTVTASPFESAEAEHLHLEVKKDNIYFNPQEIFEKMAG